MTGATAADWARRADGTAMALRLDELDRRALAVAPAARDALAAIGTAAADDLARWRDERLDRLRSEEPGVADAIRPSGAFTCGTVLATTAIATAYALFFSRGNLGVEAEVILSAVSLPIGAAILAAVLPWSRRRAVTSGHVLLSWFFAVLGVAAAFATARQAAAAGMPAVAPIVVGSAGVALVMMAAVLTVRRLRVPRTTRGAEAERVAAVRAEFGAEVARVRREARRRAEEVLDAVDAAAFATAEQELASAYEVLRARRLVAAGVEPHRPGLLLVDVPIGAAARRTRMPDEGRLVPALAPAR